MTLIQEPIPARNTDFQNKMTIAAACKTLPNKRNTKTE